ncbi:uncharacterized protein AMSG_06883 [Thecamonas trahens ATCC 50062]|uniref:Uncharacterized protein n=1 Tax=Thecamonas trahens ATCC 50062 TaxID=461836 RepID=A0A0L0DDG6_THETB|nr:hypothetical protein AMSG_06883 [Thecamonas trahens ATCC 50062]KNC50392.1 hypothetical protein AMSG_06883 [Thecamonas trahens ATCC 50062]|eukprot:XP_013756934.1 hypothetical protein AMSG_06883 [Thecamonas trahens ATCC 50062]
MRLFPGGVIGSSSALVALFSAPEAVDELPSLTRLAPTWFRSTAVAAVGVYPQSRTEAFAYGRLLERLVVAEARGDGKAIDEVLAAAAVLAGRVVTAREVKAIEDNTVAVESRRGPLSVALGMLSLVNIMWLVSIFGIAAFLLPALAICVRPLVAALISVFTRWILPMLIALQPVYELAMYAFAVLLLAEGLRMPPETGVMIALTGVVLAVPAFVYSTYLHTHAKTSMSAFSTWVSVLCTVWFVVPAIHFDDALMAWIAVASFYSAVGFSVVPLGLRYLVGFHSPETMVRVSITSTIVLGTFAALRVCGAEYAAMQLLAAPTSVFGTLTLLLAQLIASSRFYAWWSLPYYVRQLTMIATLGVLLGFGAIGGSPGMFNTATTFTVLYVVEKVLELEFLWSSSIAPLTILAIFVAMYAASLFLASHPGWLVSIAFNL